VIIESAPTALRQTPASGPQPLIPAQLFRQARETAQGIRRVAETGRAAAAMRPEEVAMAVRPLAFGARLRHGDRTLRVRKNERDARAYVVEDGQARRGTQRRDHVSLEGALRDLARSWRARLH
jgi:hypothetical protein